MIVTVSDENGIKQYNVTEHIKIIFLVLVFLALFVIGSLSFYVKSLHDQVILLEDRIEDETIVKKSNNAEVMHLTSDKNLSMSHQIFSQSDLILIKASKIQKESEQLRIIALNKAKEEKLKQEQLLSERAEAQRIKSLKLKKEREEHLKKETALQLARLEQEKIEKEKIEKKRLAKLVEEKKRQERLAKEKKKKMLKLQAIKKAKAKKVKLAKLKKKKEQQLKKEKLARQRKLAKIKEEKIISRIDSLPGIAKSKLGKRYVWGAVGPSVFDCSGFTSYVYRKKGISIPRTSRQQSKYGKLVDRKHLKPGDLIFFDTSHRRQGVINHVGMYIGNNQFIHASSAKKRVVITKLSNFYSQRFKWARRVIN